ncbi:retrovirus-related pol polyprotein from transposon TNT 1-94 [Tanacetum coccineum]
MITSLKNNLRKLKGKKIVDNAAQIPSATTIIPVMFKLDLDPLAPKVLQNRDAHIDYFKHTREQADILRGIVEQAKAKQPLDNALDFALDLFMFETHSLMSINLVESSKTLDSNTLVLSSTGLKCSTSTCRSQPTGNKRDDRILQTPSSNIKNKVEVQFEIPKPEIKIYSRRPKQIKSVGSSKKAKIVESKIANNSEPTHLWGSNATDVPSSSSLVNDRVYYVERLRHNLFSVGQFCDADLEVAFRKNTCFIRNLEGVDLLSGSRDTNLYTISLDDMLKTSSIYLLSKASKTKSWLWHCWLSHLNFGTLNKLAKDGLARGIPKLKFQKDHLCSACALGKSKKSSHQPKAKDTNQEKLYLLHLDLCGLMRVESINGKSISCSGLVQNIIPQQPCNPPKRDDWDSLFQPLFDEYFNPPTIVVSPVPVAAAPRVVEITDSPVSMSIGEDAPSTSIPST